MSLNIKLAQKQQAQRMAARMLGKELLRIIMSWKVILLLLDILLFLFLPYIEDEYYGQGGYFFILLMFLMLIYPIPEKIFFFLPMGEQQIRWYLSARCNLYSIAMMILSLGFAGIVQLSGKTPNMVYGLEGLLIVLFALEFLTYGGVSAYWKKSKKQKIWNTIIVTFYAVSLFTILIVGIFYNGWSQERRTNPDYTFLAISIVLYLIAFGIRCVSLRYAHFRDFRVLRTTYWNTRNIQREEI